MDTTENSERGQPLAVPLRAQLGPAADIEALRARVEEAQEALADARKAVQIASRLLQERTDAMREAVEPGSTRDAVLNVADALIQDALLPFAGKCLLTSKIEELVMPLIAEHPVLKQQNWSRIRIGKAMRRLGFVGFTTRMAQGWKV